LKVKKNGEKRSFIVFDSSLYGGIIKIQEWDGKLFVTCADKHDRIFSLNTGELIKKPDKCELTNEERRLRKKQYLSRVANGQIKQHPTENEEQSA
jgi:nitrite reductase/ring-hydroxylating ferredoxin subunit